MPRFVLIDQSITDVGGHHHEYAARVLHAAKAAGFEPVLAANRRCRAEREPWPVHAVYHYGFWELPYKRRRSFRHASRVRLWWTRQKIRALYSPLGYLYQSRKEGAALLPRIRASGLSVAQLALLGIPAIVALAVLRIWQTIVGLVPGRAYLSKLARGVLKLVLLPCAPFVFAWRHRYAIVRALRVRRKKAAFAADTAKLLNRLRLGAGDIVFIPTIGELEMSGLAGLFARSEAGRAASWHLLFRRNIYNGREPDYPRQDEGLRGVRNLFHEFVDNLDGRRAFFYTDTEQLTAQWARLGAGVFQTLPIPVDSAYHLACDAAPRSEGASLNTRVDERPPRVVYAGDAREEKGYQHLPRIVRDLSAVNARGGGPARPGADRPAAPPFRLVAQSYFNTEPGEPAARLARVELEQFPASRVELISRALNGDAYRDLVLSADVALVLYHRDNYYARSSGIFTEAAAAGIPTLVPAGSWMAIQLEGPIHAAHAEILRRVPESLTLDGEDVGWFIAGGRGGNPMHDGGVMLAGHRPRCTKVMVPPRAGWVHISFSCRMDLAKDFIAVDATQTDRLTRRKHTRRTISADFNGRYSRLVRLRPGCDDLTLSFMPVFTETMGLLSDVRLRFLAYAGDLPLYGAGALYDRDEEISDRLAEILTHMDHYRASARAFAQEWRRRHTPERLVELLAANSTVAPPVARGRPGTGWSDGDDPPRTAGPVVKLKRAGVAEEAP